MDGIKDMIACDKMSAVLRLNKDRRTWRYIVVNINIDTALRNGKIYSDFSI